MFCSLKKGHNPKILMLCLVVVNSVQPFKKNVFGSVGFKQITDSMSTGASGRVIFTLSVIVYTYTLLSKKLYISDWPITSNKQLTQFGLVSLFTTF